MGGVKPGNSQLNRRDLLKAGACALGGAAISIASRPYAALALDDRAGKAIDAHVHVWTPDTKRYPLAAGFSPEQMQPPSFTPEQLLAHARPLGVGRIVLIQMSFYGFDNSYMLDTMRAYPGVFSGVAVIDEHARGVSQTMRDLKKQGVRGFRLYPNERLVEPFLSSPAMAAMWKMGADEHLAMCMLINPDSLELLDKMCQKYPDTPVVIDHFARIGVDGTIRDADLDNLCRLARHKHTHVKISAFYALGKKQAPYTDLGPMIRRLVEAYSPKRLMWATDCPFQVQNGHAYRDSIELVRSRLDFLSDDDRDWLLQKTAERVFFS
jgi:predicted TIM-barrel fold metal-dependent hydrolase